MARDRRNIKMHKGKKTYVKSNNTFKKKKLNHDVSKNRKNMKFIHRSKDMEAFHLKQKNIEDSYRAVADSSFYNYHALGLPKEDFDASVEFPKEITIEESYNNLVKEFSSQHSDSDDNDDAIGDDIDDDATDDDDITDNDDDVDDYNDGDNDEDENLIEDDDDEEETAPESYNSNNSILKKKDIENDITGHNNIDNKSDSDDNIGGDNTKVKSHICDPFGIHLGYEISLADTQGILSPTSSRHKFSINWPCMRNIEVEHFKHKASLGLPDLPTKPLHLIKNSDLEAIGVKLTLSQNVQLPLSSLQSEFYLLLNSYHDIFYPERSLSQSEELRKVYCLHALNHMLKTRSRILHHNAKLTAAASDKTKKKVAIITPDSYRDQGLVRPKVLIVVPFREAAFRVVSDMADLLFGHDTTDLSKASKNIVNFSRFKDEFTGDTIQFPKTNPKPEDYEQTFKGNTDDNFRIGLSLTKKSIKLYTDFYGSDIIIASPLGLRMVIGAPGSADRDYDFLNSIELLILDQLDLFYAQNWENVLHLMDHLHLQPQSLHDTDFQRVRTWCLDGLSRFYRQTVLLTSHQLPEFRTLLNSKSSNYRGKVVIANPILIGAISNVIVPLAQVFNRIDVTNLDSLFDKRFQFFIENILPRFRGISFAHTLIYVPSYFDYVRLRNYFKSETINFVQICEYTKDSKIARARDMFFHSGAHFLLYSERAHFFRRTRIKGIRHLIMYQPPQWPHLYSEVINLMQNTNQNKRDGLDSLMTVTILYTKYDYLQLSGIMGTKNAKKLIKSSKSIHTFTSE